MKAMNNQREGKLRDFVTRHVDPNLAPVALAHAFGLGIVDRLERLRKFEEQSVLQIKICRSSEYGTLI